MVLWSYDLTSSAVVAPLIFSSLYCSLSDNRQLYSCFGNDYILGVFFTLHWHIFPYSPYPVSQSKPGTIVWQLFHHTTTFALCPDCQQIKFGLIWNMPSESLLTFIPVTIVICFTLNCQWPNHTSWSFYQPGSIAVPAAVCLQVSHINSYRTDTEMTGYILSFQKCDSFLTPRLLCWAQLCRNRLCFHWRSSVHFAAP